MLESQSKGFTGGWDIIDAINEVVSTFGLAQCGNVPLGFWPFKLNQPTS
jgi:hypothetical protein